MENNYSVYQHVTPDGLYYFGQTQNVEKRWGNNGSLYKGTALQPYIEKYGHEFWTIIDRIVSARHAVEAYISREMYIRGFLDYERLVCEIERDV